MSMRYRFACALFAGIATIVISGCNVIGRGDEHPPPSGANLEQLAGNPFFEAVVGVRSGASYRSRLLTAPTLYFREQPCAFNGGFRGAGKLWYLLNPADTWRPVDAEVAWPEGSKYPVSNGKMLEDWWAVAAVPDDKAVFIFQCGDGEVAEKAPAETRHVSTRQNQVPTPDPPRRWYPFRTWPGSENYSAYQNRVNLDLSGTQPAACPTRVHAFNLYLCGQLRGNLSFNQHKRGGPSYAHSMNGGNTKLGGFQNYQTRLNSWLAYKYQVEIRILGPMQHAFYGQMIADPQAFSFTDPVFHDDSPANDWPGKRWNLAAGERKSSFPVIELVTLTNSDHILRYIDAPGGGEVMGIGISDKYSYVIIYAGACGVLTHVKYLQLYYPDQFRWTDGTPRATEMSFAQFRNAVGDWSFAN